VVWASLLLRPHIEGTRFTLRTDHAALKWMLHIDGAHGGLARWRLRLAESDKVFRRDRVHPSTRRTRCRASRHPRSTTGPYPTRYLAWRYPTREPRGSYHRKRREGFYTP